MSLLNRLALIVRPKRRYKEWADSLPDGAEDPVFNLEQARSTPAVYLVASNEPLEDLIDRYADDIFEDQLEGWHTDEKAWPVNRSPHVFRDWFDVSLAEWVVDLDDLEPLDGDEEIDQDQPELSDDMSGGSATALFCAWCRASIDEDTEITTVTLMGPRETQQTPDTIELRVAGRTVPALVPPDDSPAGKRGVMALVMFCTEECGQAFQDAWRRERGAINS